jgi:hypothetical protein
MREYYKNAILPIATDLAEGGEIGFLRHRRANSQGTFNADDTDPCLDHVNIRDAIKVAWLSGNTCLSRRAWTLQKDILASRALNYS